MIDLSHIYFLGEDPPQEIKTGSRPPAKPFRTPRKRSPTGLKNHPRTVRGHLRTLSPLFAFILGQSGLDSGAYQRKPLNRRLGACLRVLRATSEEAALKTLQRRPELVPASLSALLIGVSQFFRDEAVFEHLKQVILPELLQKNRALRVYSAGCSAGHELYSVAMILDEIGALESCQLLGVDCRSNAIVQAGSGCFALSDLNEIGEPRRQRYFRCEGRRATLSPRLRAKTAWQVADFGVFCDLPPWDMILFRNVAIYLELEYAYRIWHRLDQQLKPGGVVVTGSAERPPEDLRWRRESACIYRKPPTLTS